MLVLGTVHEGLRFSPIILGGLGACAEGSVPWFSARAEVNEGGCLDFAGMRVRRGSIYSRQTPIHSVLPFALNVKTGAYHKPG